MNINNMSQENCGNPLNILPGKSHGQRVWWPPVYSIPKNWTQLKLFSTYANDTSTKERLFNWMEKTCYNRK